MERNARSSERNSAGIRKHKRTTDKINLKKLNKDSDSDSSKSKQNKSRSRSISKDKPTYRKRYTIKEKIAYVEKYKAIKEKEPEKGFKKISEELDVAKNNLKEWVKQYMFMKDIKGINKKKNLPGAGRIPETIEIEEELIKWIEEQRRLEIAINSNEIISKAIELDKSLENKSFNTLHRWCYRFLGRYCYSIRRTTHVGQKLKENSASELKKFYRILYNIRNELEKSGNDTIIYNMDETPLVFEMIANTTISKIGAKTVSVRTFGSNRSRFTIILCIGSNGEKIPPLVIFKGKKNALKEKNLNQYIAAKNYKIFALCQENSWADKEIFLYWVDNVFLNNKFIPNNINKILILDRATTHYDDTLTDKLLKKNARYVLIPPGLTRFIQPLDVSINGPFKKFLHHWDSDYRINHLNSKKPDCYEIIDAIVSLWYDDTKITVDIINLLNS